MPQGELGYFFAPPWVHRARWLKRHKATKWRATLQDKLAAAEYAT